MYAVGSTKLSTCPLEGAYHFTYNNNTGGFCRTPTSYAKPCSITSHFQLHFQHCPGAAYTYQRGVPSGDTGNQDFDLFLHCVTCRKREYMNTYVYVQCMT